MLSPYSYELRTCKIFSAHSSYCGLSNLHCTCVDFPALPFKRGHLHPTRLPQRLHFCLQKITQIQISRLLARFSKFQALQFDTDHFTQQRPKCKASESSSFKVLCCQGLIKLSLSIFHKFLLWKPSRKK